MAAYTLLRRFSKSQTPHSSLFLHITRPYFTSLSTSINAKTLPPPHFQARSLASDATLFDKMIAGNQRKYYMLGGKGGVGKTSCAASLAVKFANHGHPTIVISTDPAHSLSDSFDQDLTGGTLIRIQGFDSPLFGLEAHLYEMLLTDPPFKIDPVKVKEEHHDAAQIYGGTKNLWDSMGLGMLGELKFEELLDTPPPGLDEAIAMSKVMELVDLSEYSMFTRIVLDTAPTGHTLRLLELPEFMDAYTGKLMKMKKKIASATSAVKSVFKKEQAPPAEDFTKELEHLRERMAKVRDLFRDSETTEFIIVTIPTRFRAFDRKKNTSRLMKKLRQNGAPNEVMAVRESSRLHASLKKENVPVKRLVVNQILPPSATDCKFCSVKRKDQLRALDMIRSDSELGSLVLTEAPLVDMEIRGIPALQFLGNIVWK